DPTSSRILWLDGLVGTGTTTIAFSLSERLSKAEHLGASYFYSSFYKESAEVRNVVPTLALSLASRLPSYRRALMESLKRDRQAGLRNISTQFSKLLDTPLRESAREMTARTFIPVLVIDGLDACC
ncbi:hypothetical protein BDV98DRAFT_482884, partial [Pterulicium gracile]